MPDVYPILKFPEVKGRNAYIKVRPWVRRPPPQVVVEACDDKGSGRGVGVAKEISMDQVENEFQRLVEQRVRLATVGAGLKQEVVGGVRKSRSVEK